MIITNGPRKYRIANPSKDLVASSANYRLYLCEDKSACQDCLLQIAADTAADALVSKAASLLRGMKHRAQQLEVQHAWDGDGQRLNYDRLFPTITDCFRAAGQGDRLVNILSFKDVDSVTELLPLSNLARKDRRRIDLRSSAWIMGRLLKLLGFIHADNIAAPRITGNVVLIQPDKHFAVLMDWTGARDFKRGVPADVSTDNIAHAALTVFRAIGGDPATGEYPYEYESPEDQQYVELLWLFICRNESNAEQAHRRFYGLVDRLFGKKFHPFTHLPLLAD